MGQVFDEEYYVFVVEHLSPRDFIEFLSFVVFDIEKSEPGIEEPCLYLHTRVGFNFDGGSTPGRRILNFVYGYSKITTYYVYPKETKAKIPSPVRLRQLCRPVQCGDDLIEYGGEVFALYFIDAPLGFEFLDSVLELFLNLLHIDYIYKR